MYLYYAHMYISAPGVFDPDLARSLNKELFIPPTFPFCIPYSYWLCARIALLHSYHIPVGVGRAGTPDTELA